MKATRGDLELQMILQQTIKLSHEIDKINKAKQQTRIITAAVDPRLLRAKNVQGTSHEEQFKNAFEAMQQKEKDEKTEIDAVKTENLENLSNISDISDAEEIKSEDGILLDDPVIKKEVISSESLNASLCANLKSEADMSFEQIIGCYPAPKKFNIIKTSKYKIPKDSCMMSKYNREESCGCELKHTSLEAASETSDNEELSPNHHQTSYNCGTDDCVNRAIFMECTKTTCPCRNFCKNQRIQKQEYSEVKVFHAAEKGHGLEAVQDIKPGQFVMEYIGDVIDDAEHYSRVQEYEDEGIQHHFFMQVRKDFVIDATKTGNISRFINHSCAPNARTQKWSVKGVIRIAFEAIKEIAAGEEITFDYNFVSYGQKEQVCYCGAAECRGVLGKPQKVKKSIKIEPTLSFEEIVLETELDILMLVRRMYREVYDDRQKMECILNVSRLFSKIENDEHDEETRNVIFLCREFARLKGFQILKQWYETAGDETSQNEIIDILSKSNFKTQNFYRDSGWLELVERYNLEQYEEKLYLLHKAWKLQAGFYCFSKQ